MLAETNNQEVEQSATADPPRSWLRRLQLHLKLTHLPLSGILIALSTPFLLGLAPIFGKLAIGTDPNAPVVDPFTIAALRTITAVVLLWVVYGLFYRKYLYIYPAGLLGCVVIGVINGIGSLFYYGGLGALHNASLAQLLNGTYLVFAVLISRAGGQSVDRRTIIRVVLALLAISLITRVGTGTLDWVGVGLMLGNAVMFAGTMMLSQYVLFEMPAQTVTLYILSTMCIVVSMVWLTLGSPPELEALEIALPPILMLGVTTALARLAMFTGVKFLGGMQTAILAVMEIAVTLLLATAFLGETLYSGQIIGVILLMICLLLIRQRDLLPRGFNPNALIVTNMADIQFQSIAFHRAFGTHDHDNDHRTMATITTQEMQMIQRMMGAGGGSVDPFPIGKSNRLLENLDGLSITSTPTPPPATLYDGSKPTNH